MNQIFKQLNNHKMLKKEKPMLSVAAIIQSQGRWDRLAYSGNILHRGLIIMFRSLYDFT